MLFQQEKFKVYFSRILSKKYVLDQNIFLAYRVNALSDGNKNCNDGSDELKECCTLPPSSADKKFTVTCPQDIKCNQQPGETVPKYTEISLECRKGYIKDSQEPFISICSSTGWLPSIPNCKSIDQKQCNPLEVENMDVACYRSGEKVKCDSNVVAGTTARPQCKPLHHPIQEVRYREITCQWDGKWTDNLFVCVPDCGKKYGNAIKLIGYGQVEKYGDSPWNVGVYDVSKKEKLLVCGGTIISAQLVVTSAHCFYDVTRQALRNAEHFEVAVSKLTRNYTIKDNGQTKKYKIRKIFVHENYYGDSNNYDADIAILWLFRPMNINSVVLPACLDYKEKYPFNPGENANLKIVGWGENENNVTSETLLTANLPFISHSRCLSMIPDSSKQFVVTGKFCAGSTNNSAPHIQTGDSGAGLIYRDPNSGLHYLRGVASIKPSQELRIATFVDVTQYLEWIHEIQKKVEPQILQTDANIQPFKSATQNNMKGNDQNDEELEKECNSDPELYGEVKANISAQRCVSRR